MIGPSSTIVVPGIYARSLGARSRRKSPPRITPAWIRTSSPLSSLLGTLFAFVIEYLSLSKNIYPTLFSNPFIFFFFLYPFFPYSSFLVRRSRIRRRAIGYLYDSITYPKSFQHPSGSSSAVPSDSICLNAHRPGRQPLGLISVF